MEDHPFTEDASSFGKRKRSPDNLVDASIPTSHYDGQQPRTSDEEPIQSVQIHPLPKRPRLPPKPPLPVSGVDTLPSALWQLIFSYVDPAALSCLVCVNVRFRSLLDSRYDLPKGEENFNIPLRSQENIWQSSRRRFIRTMPKPMAELSEQAQFVLTFGSKCQFCGRFSQSRPSSSGSWFGSAVANPVRIVWPFKVRSCTTCLVSRIQKDTDVLLSDASPLRPGLPFALFTQNMLYVPAEVVRNSPVQDSIQMTKYHFLPQIEALSRKAREAQSLGLAAAEGWFKGLPQEAQLAQNEAARFEHWEVTGALSIARSSIATRDVDRKPRVQLENFALKPSNENLPSLPKFPPTTDSMDGPPSLIDVPHMPLHTYGIPPGLETPYKTQIYSDANSMDSQRSGRGQKAAPSSREIARIRSRKKHDIVERCRKLNPPISLDMLERLDAFEAALQIPMALNDNAWEILKQRLMQQRQKVVLQDQARNNVTQAPVPGQFRPPSRTDEYVLAHADMPVRQRLCEIAEEYIKQKWGLGGFITYPSSPHFAADVLIHTRQSYLDHKARIEKLEAQNGYLKFASDEEEALTLDDMKWLFEQCIRPRTEQIRKDLFFCRVCTSQGIIKSYPFDSIMQHFASKHTSEFSRGTQVLSWKAKWPDEPPFEAHPERMRTPEPSITHTPTLSNIPLSITSAGSKANTIAQSIGWKSPDTMSLLSDNASMFSAALPSTQPQQMSGVAPPGHSMFHIQRDALASEIAHGWHMVKNTPNIPESLQVYLALNYGVQNFRRKFRNEPSLELFNDCLAKSELADVREVENLKCWECSIRRDPNAHASWSLQHLISHFERSHLERYTTNMDRLKWYTDMVTLPEPALIKSLSTVGDLPVPLHKSLLDANITAITKATEGTRTQPSHHSLAPDDRRIGNEYNNPLPYDRVPDPFQTAATWGGFNSSRDILSASSGTLEEDSIFKGNNAAIHKMGPNPYRQLIELVPSPKGQTTSSRPGSALGGRDGETTFTAPEPMSRTNTMRSARSQRSFGRNPAVSTTEDFLSTIESSLEVEMADSGSNFMQESTNMQVPSRSTSTAGSTNRTNRRTSPIPSLHRGNVTISRNRREHDPSPRRTGSGAQSPANHHLASSLVREREETVASSPATMTRGSSRMIEFDDEGTPIQSEGRVHQVSSPPRYRYITRPADTYSYTSEYVTPSSYPTYQEVRATTIQPAGYHDHRGASQYIYEPVVQDPPVTFRDRIYDPLTRQYYVAERPTVTRYVPICDPHSRPVVRYDDRGLPVEYPVSEVSDSRYEDRGAATDSRHDEGFNQGYQRR